MINTIRSRFSCLVVSNPGSVFGCIQSRFSVWLHPFQVLCLVNTNRSRFSVWLYPIQVQCLVVYNSGLVFGLILSNSVFNVRFNTIQFRFNVRFNTIQFRFNVRFNTIQFRFNVLSYPIKVLCLVVSNPGSMFGCIKSRFGV